MLWSFEKQSVHVLQAFGIASVRSTAPCTLDSNMMTRRPLAGMLCPVSDHTRTPLATSYEPKPRKGSVIRSDMQIRVTYTQLDPLNV